MTREEHSLTTDDAAPGQLYFRGEVYTVDEARPRAEAVAVSGERIIAVGPEAECRAALGRDYEEVDLRGRALLPGFIDTHLHPVLMIYFAMNVDLRGTRSIKELQARLGEMSRRAGPGSWVVGLQFDEQGLDQPRLPDRHDLDAACPDRPAMIVKHDGHMVIANTRVLEACHVSPATTDPEGGRIDRDAHGHPTGRFLENAVRIPLATMPIPDIAQFTAGAKSVFARLAANGITSAGAVLQTGQEGPAGDQGALELPAMQLFLEHVPINLYFMLIARDLARVEQARKTPLHQGEDGRHRLAGLKLYADGTFGSCTAYMHEPFADHPQTRGFLVTSEEELYRRMAAGHEVGLQVCIHAIGDAANELVVSLFERLLRERPRADHRHRLEHASVLNRQTIERMARLGLVAAVQPLFIHSEKHWLEKRLGPERIKWTYPFRSLVEAGVKVAGASDAPIESLNVLHAIQCCITREGFVPQQGLSAGQALRLFTIDAAYAQHEERIKGSISPGKVADLVILSGNPLSVRPEEITSLRVQRTICRGRVIYEGE